MRVDDPQHISSHAPHPAAWPPLTRIACGFFSAYFVFVWLPWTLMIFGWLKIDWFIAVGQWPITHVFGLPEHFVPSPAATNFLPHYLATLIFAIVSAVLGIAWCVVDRRGTTHMQVFTWLHTAVRFSLATLMLMYGWHKVLPGQFGKFATGGGIDYLIHQVGQLPPRDLLWAFMEGSRLYQVFAGLLEVAGGLLLLTRTTAMLGALISVAAMTNVVVLDIAYDVGVKWLAGQILLMGLFVTAPYAHQLADALVRQVARRPPLFQNRRADRAVRVVGVVVGILITIWAYRYAQATVADNRAEPQTALHGIWDVEEITQSGTLVPLLITDKTLWRRLTLAWSGDGGTFLVWMSDALTRCSSTIDPSAKTITLTPLALDQTLVASVRGRPQGPTPVLSFRYSRPAKDQLILRLRLFQSADYQLITHKPEWRW